MVWQELGLIPSISKLDDGRFLYSTKGAFVCYCSEPPVSSSKSSESLHEPVMNLTGPEAKFKQFMIDEIGFTESFASQAAKLVMQRACNDIDAFQPFARKTYEN